MTNFPLASIPATEVCTRRLAKGCGWEWQPTT